MGKTTHLSAERLAEHVFQGWTPGIFCLLLRRCGWLNMGMPGGRVGLVGQQAGDYPTLLAERMAWCLERADRCCDQCHAA
ncbi:hypothetical protein ABZT03_43560 [Streptomyces sp. NPDC005574]|uniref:hypothetical protein n=1 Tax=Streptomyces sp. NPDC005574 TaxID=3156891 RepID=UPI0033A5C8F3